MEKIFFLSLLCVDIQDDGHQTYGSNNFTMYANQIIRLYTINLYSGICYFSIKLEKNDNFNQIEKNEKFFKRKKKGGNLNFKRATTWHETRNQPQKEQ